MSESDVPPPVQLTLARFSGPGRAQWLASSAAVLSAEELERVAAILDPDTRVQHALGRALVRRAAARVAGCEPSAVRVAVTDAGRPYLPDLPGLHVSVSHTRHVVVVASSSAGPVGVDVEHPGATPPRPRRLAARLFTGEEVSALHRLPDDAVEDWFSTVWTVKEAVGKALGVGVIPALSGVVVDSRGSQLRLAGVREGPPASSWTLHRLTAPGGDEKIAVALPSPSVGLAPLELLTLERFAATLRSQGETLPGRPGSTSRRARR